MELSAEKVRLSCKVYEAKHEALISTELFEEVQRRMKDRCKPNKRKEKYFIFGGMLQCATCGCRITAERQKGHHYYRCTKRKGSCAQPYLREEALADQMADYLRKNTLPVEHVKWLASALESERATSLDKENIRISHLTEKMRMLDERLEHLMEGFLDRMFSLTEYQAQKNKFILAKQDLKEEIAALRRSNESWFEPAIRFVKDSTAARDAGDSVGQRKSKIS